MISVSLRQMQHNLSAILRQVDRGQEILVTRRKRVVARLVPASPIPATKIKWPDFRRRASGVKLKGPLLTQTLLEEREA